MCDEEPRQGRAARRRAGDAAGGAPWREERARSGGRRRVSREVHRGAELWSRGRREWTQWRVGSCAGPGVSASLK